MCGVVGLMFGEVDGYVLGCSFVIWVWCVGGLVVVVGYDGWWSLFMLEGVLVCGFIDRGVDVLCVGFGFMFMFYYVE
ncbi:phosphomannomutase, partial [Enterococcus hirae]